MDVTDAFLDWGQLRLQAHQLVQLLPLNASRSSPAKFCIPDAFGDILEELRGDRRVDLPLHLEFRDHGGLLAKLVYEHADQGVPFRVGLPAPVLR